MIGSNAVEYGYFASLVPARVRGNTRSLRGRATGQGVINGSLPVARRDVLSRGEAFDLICRMT